MGAMSLDFLNANGARRVRNYDTQPSLLTDGITQSEDPETKLDWDIEVPMDDWRPIDVRNALGGETWQARPERFVDGKDVGRTVAWLQSRERFPVPVRLSQIGAVVMRGYDGELRREYQKIERVVSLAADLFPWDEVESFARALRVYNYRLLIVPEPTDGWSFDFERMRHAAQDRTNYEMAQLERQALNNDQGVPTIVDGRLAARTTLPSNSTDAVVGIIKTHSRNYLHPTGWGAYYALEPGQRTPAFRMEGRSFDLISWYVRLDGSLGEMPNWGVVRLEIPQMFFKDGAQSDWGYLDRVSRVIYDYRTRDRTYRRAPVSILPIQRAEESLGALFTDSDNLIGQFYRMTGL